MRVDVNLSISLLDNVNFLGPTSYLIQLACLFSHLTQADVK